MLALAAVGVDYSFPALAAQALSPAEPQRIVASGVVKDSAGEPVVGATVRDAENPRIAVSTDIDGAFSLSVAQGSKLVFSFIGCKPVEAIAAKGMEIVLEDDSQILNDVVVVGYGTMRKKDVTGAVFQVKTEDLEKEAPNSVQDLLRGVPGLSVGYDASAKGTSADLQIRGQNSLGTSSYPLIILDGMIFYGEMSEINPQDIAQIDVLKDASSSAVYGAKAANGVIIITTKKGKEGKTHVTLSADWTYNTLGSNNRKTYDAQSYLDYRRDWYVSGTYGKNAETGQYGEYQQGYSAGYFDYPSASNLSKYGITLDEWRAYTNAGDDQSNEEIYASRLNITGTALSNYLSDNTFDWYNYALRNSWSQNYNLGLSGGTERSNYYLSLGWLENNGVSRGNYYKAFRANMKINSTITPWLQIGANVSFQDRTDSDEAIDWATVITANSPYAQMYDADGNLDPYPMGNIAGNTGSNHAYYWKNAEKEAGVTVLNSILYAKVTLPFGITYTFNAAPRYQWWYDREFYSNAAVNRTDASAYRKNSKNFDWSLNNTLAWDHTFGNVHHFNVTLVQEAEERRYWSESISAQQLEPSDALGFHLIDVADKEASSFSSTDTHQTADALLARVHYGYDNRYLFTGSVRRDGYSAFGTSNPRATFFAGAIAWAFTNEKFFNWQPLSTGKLRLSLGENGNRDLGDVYLALANLSRGVGAKYGYLNNSGTLTDYIYLTMSRLANKSLQWEKTTSWNAGLDLGFFNDRLNVSLDVYRQPTTQMIMSQSLPGFSGFGSITTNLGEVVNSGYEIAISSVNVQQPNFQWTTTFSFGYNKNRIKHLYYEYEDVLDADGNVIGSVESDDISNNWFIGRPISDIWDYKVIGIWQLDEADEAALYGQQPGDPKVWNNPDNDVYDEDGNLVSIVYSNEDKVHIGQTTPKYNWSLRNEFQICKNWNISFNLYGKAGFKKGETNYLNRDNASSKFTYGYNTYVKEYWTLDNPSNKYGRLDAQGPSGVTTPTKYHDGDFIRLENIAVSYTLPQSLTRKFWVDRLTLSASVKNVAVWAKDWEYWDPQTGGLAPRQFNFGVNVTF